MKNPNLNESAQACHPAFQDFDPQEAGKQAGRFEDITS